MTSHLILTFVADDRPGLVDALSQAIGDTGGNWLESKTVRMAEKFAGIMRVEMPDDKSAEALKARLSALQSVGIDVTTSDARDAPKATGSPLVIDLVGPDHPGIVRDITHCLASHGASIETMETDITDAPMGGGVLFHAHIEVRSPAGLDEEALRGELEQLATALMVDLDFHEPAAPADG